MSCIDPDSPSKLLVTTRVRGLVQNASELTLELMTTAESVDLLLRTAKLNDVADDAAAAAAKTIAELCGYLPLFLSICR